MTRPAPRAVLAAVVWMCAGTPGPAGGQEPIRPEPAVAPPDRRDLDAARLEAGRRALIDEALASGAYDRAQALLLEAVEGQPASPPLLRVLGGVLFLRGEYLGSAVAFKKAEALAPLDDRSRFTLAMSYVVMGRRDWARPELEKLAGSDARSPLYRYWLARLDYDQERYAEAAAGFRRALALDPQYLKAHDHLGLCYDALGRYDDAVRSYREAIRLNRDRRPPSPWPPLNLGILLMRLDRLDEAEALLRESARDDPGFAPARYQLGLVLEKRARTADAIAELTRAAELDASYPEPHYALARIYRRTGEAAKADEALQRFLALKKEKGQAGGPR